jgi:aspartyl-tRNA(Asn)/glutamyl-tRNA(Gln) amidotransferase subunit A
VEPFPTVVGLRQRIADGSLSPVEAAEVVLARIDAMDGAVNAFCALEPENVLAQARRAERAVARGEPLGPLHGVPLAVKDLIFAAGLPISGGSEAYRGFTPDIDDVAVERLRAAGAIVLGKTNANEFGVGANTTDSPTGGTTRNPWDLGRAVGGSSGGSAAAVAAGMAPAALGSDGGGSIRIPSSFCGIYGLKPSFGRIPLYPGCRDPRYPGLSAWESLEHIGPMTRTVADAALLLDVLTGPDPRDRHSLPREFGALAPGAFDPRLDELTVGFSPDLGGGTPVEPEVRTLVERAAAQFEALGARVEPVDRPFADPVPILAATIPLEFDLGSMRPLVDAHRATLNSRIAEWVDTEWRGEDFSDALTARKRLALEVAELFGRYDLLLTPTTPTPALPLELPKPMTIGGHKIADPRRMLQPFVCAFNLTGNPAASLPCGFTADGLPVGLQVVGGHLADLLVLRASLAYEAIAPWDRPRPPLSA